MNRDSENLTIAQIQETVRGGVEGTHLRFALTSVVVTLDEAEAFADAAESGESFSVRWAPTPGGRHGAVKAIRAAVERLRSIQAERDAARAAKQAGVPSSSPPAGVSESLLTRAGKPVR